MAYGPLNLKPDEFEKLQPYELFQLYEGYLWRQDNEALFYGHLLLSVVNYTRKKEYQFANAMAFVAPLLSEKTRRDIRAGKEAARKKEEEKFKKKFNIPEVRS